jgi:hypothetical protein
MDGIKDRLDLLIVAGDPPLQFSESLGQFPARGHHFSQAHKGAHNLDVHLNRARAV